MNSYIPHEFDQLTFADVSCAVLDTETTGLAPPIKACEVAYIGLPSLELLRGAVAGLSSDQERVDFVFNWPVGLVFSARYNPGKPIHPQASAVTGIYDKDVKWKPSINTFKLPEQLSYFIAHNSAFDYEVLFGKEALTERPWKVKPLCSKKLAQTIWAKSTAKKPTELANHKLVTLIQFLYPDHQQPIVEKAHGALQDCYMVLLLLCKLVARKELAELTTWDDLFRIATPSQTRPS